MQIPLASAARIVAAERLDRNWQSLRSTPPSLRRSPTSSFELHARARPGAASDGGPHSRISTTASCVRRSAPSTRGTASNTFQSEAIARPGSRLVFRRERDRATEGRGGRGDQKPAASLPMRYSERLGPADGDGL